MSSITSPDCPFLQEAFPDVPWDPSTCCDETLGVRCEGSPRAITELYISGYQNERPIPQQLAKLQDLTYLGLRNNHTGPIPEFLTTMKKLSTINFRGNRLNGSIPSFLSKLTALENLDLSDNELTGSIPKSFEEFPVLKIFNIYSNKLYGELPAFKDRLLSPNKTQLGIAFNYFSGKIPESDINNGLVLSMNCFSNEELLPAIRQFTNQGRPDLLNATQRPSSECLTFLAQIPKNIATQVPITTTAASIDSNPGSGASTSPPNLGLIIGVTSAILLIITISITLIFRQRRRQKKQPIEEDQTLSQQQPDDVTSTFDEPIKQGLLDAPTMFGPHSASERDVKDGNLFRNIELTEADIAALDVALDHSSKSSGSGGVDVQGLEIGEKDGIAPSSSVTSSSSVSDAALLSRSNVMDTGSISSWNPDQVASVLASAGVNKGFIDIMKEQGVDGNQLVQLDHENLEQMGIGPFNARVLLLIAIGMLKEKNEGDGPPGYA
ncbi:hypothetical protein HDU97_004268 [Phlyctochytrium planicorne]|nr:hypothetical protein HDU97_004268 [Phlyctochytrium planicorne]